jgi:drug/metabolite transporter (DMT)-like permease
MVWMLLCILSGAAFGHIMRHAQVRQRHLAWVGAWNYLFAGLAAWVWLGLQPGAALNWPAAVLGTLCGASYVAAFFALDHAIRAAGVGVTLSVQWLGVSLPVAASILFWGEIPSLMQALGLGMAALSLPLLACGSSAADAPRAAAGGSRSCSACSSWRGWSA